MPPKTIRISGEEHRKEGVTDEAVTPGALLEYGGSNDVQNHSTAGGNAAKMFALENDLVGDGIDDAYAAGETVQIGVFRAGAKVYAWLEAGENVAVGAKLESAGNGSLQAHTAVSTNVPVDAIVAEAREAVNNGGGSSVRIEVEVL